MEDIWFERIEAYLNGTMDDGEKAIFEKELSTNQELLSLFRVYTTTETQMGTAFKHSAEEAKLKESLQTLNNKYFKSQSQLPLQPVRSKIHVIYKYTTLIAASVVLILVAVLIFLQLKQTPQKLADTYIDTHLSEVSQTMNSSQDSLQLAISAYNNKKYNEALLLFRNIYKNDPGNTEAKKNIGLIYLVTKQYDKALQEFNELSQIKNLYSNPGKFLKAVTLMQRNQADDMQKARQLLEQVVDEKAAGSNEAAEWLKEW